MKKNIGTADRVIRMIAAIVLMDLALDGDVSREECLLDFEVADTAGDGYIEFKEFVAWWTN